MTDEEAKRAWVIRVLGVSLEPDQTSPKLDQSGLRQRTVAARERMVKLPEPERFDGLLRDAILAEKAGETDKALEILERLEAALTSAERAALAGAEIAKAREGLNVSVVQFAKLRLKLVALEAAVPMAIDACQDAMAEVLEVEFAEGEPTAEVEAFIDSLDEVVPPPPAALRLAIDAMAGTADVTARAKARGDALTAIKDYRASLAQLSFLELFERTDHGSYQIASSIETCLGDLEAAMKP